MALNFLFTGALAPLWVRCKKVTRQSRFDGLLVGVCVTKKQSPAACDCASLRLV